MRGGALDFEVHIRKVSTGEVANFLEGYIIFNGEKLGFKGIAFGRYGGQNVSPTLGRKATKKLKELRIDLEKFTALLQRKLVEGDIVIDAPKRKQGAIEEGFQP